MTAIELQNLLTDLLWLSAETEVVEFKEANKNFDFSKLGKYFSALSKEVNLKDKKQAWLVFGVNNSHKIVGSQFRTRRKDLDHLKQEIAEKINNRLTFKEIYELDTESGRVILFEIPPALAGNPSTFEGHPSGRDESLGALNQVEYNQIINQSKNSDWSIEF